MTTLTDNGVVRQPLADRLLAANIRDVKFFFQPGVDGKPLSETKASVDLVLSTYLDRNFELMGKIGDSCTAS
jgi:hypothetical protein